MPLGAFLLTQLYYTLYPLLERVPPVLFWTVVFVAAAGVAGGVVRIVAVLRQHRSELNSRAIAWLIAAIVTTLVCAWVALSLAVPWLV